MTIKIMVDSACDLTNKYYNEFDIEMVPLTLHLDDEDYRDGIDIEPKTVYERMRNGSRTKTSQVTPQAFKDVFSSYVSKNKPLIYLAFSSELSGTYQTAKMIEQEIKEEHPNAVLHVVDTKCASIGYGLVALRAAKLAKEGATVEDIIEMATYHAKHMEHIFTVDDLEYLLRGGRVTKTQAFVGSLLKIKPILNVDNGKLIPIEKVRGSKRVFTRMIDIMKERGTDFENQIIGISHADNLEAAEKLANMIRETFNPKDIIIEMVGSVIGAHAGPGTISLFFLNKPYQ